MLIFRGFFQATFLTSYLVSFGCVICSSAENINQTFQKTALDHSSLESTRLSMAGHTRCIAECGATCTGDNTCQGFCRHTQDGRCAILRIKTSVGDTSHHNMYSDYNCFIPKGEALNIFYKKSCIFINHTFGILQRGCP